jgi:hypothetical protein
VGQLAAAAVAADATACPHHSGTAITAATVTSRTAPSSLSLPARGALPTITLLQSARSRAR